MKWLVVFAALLCQSALAGFAIFQVSSTVFSGWKIQPIGGGGFISNIDIQCDQGVGACNNTGTTTKVARADVYGAYWFNPSTTNCGNANATGCWQQILTATAMPGSAVTGGCNGAASGNGGCGVYEIVIAPSNTSHFYMLYNGVVYSTTNHGGTWTAVVGWTALGSTDINANDKNRGMGNFMAVDPANENVLLVGTPATGLYYSLDTTSGSAFVHVASIPNSTSANGGYGNTLVAFDRTTTSGGSTPGIYASAYGSGAWHTSTGPAGTWTKITSTPTTHARMIVDQSGNLYLIDNQAGNPGGALHLWNGSSWTTPGSGTIGTAADGVAVDPANANHIYVIKDGGNLFGTITGPAGSWFNPNPFTRVATDIPWMAQNNTNENFMGGNAAVFDPSSSNKLYYAEGIGIWFTNPPTSSVAFNWNSQTAAIEELDMNQIVSPLGGNPVASAQDRPEYYLSSIYPSIQGMANPTTNSIIDGYSIDWATASPSTIFGMGMTPPGFSFVNESGLSTDGGQTFTAFGGAPSVVTSNSNAGSCIAVTDSNHAVWIPNASVPYVTANGGMSWTVASGLPSTGWPNATNAQTDITCASDKVNASTMYLYTYNADGSFSDGIYRTTNGGVNWSRQCLSCGAGSSFTSAGSGVNGFFDVQLAASPVEAGVLLFTPGHNLTPSHPATQPFWLSTNAGVTWTAVPNMQDVWAAGFGAAKNGSTHAAIYAWGWFNGTLGTWRSNDNGSTWTQLDNGYPMGIFAAISSLTGDNNTYGTVYECFNGAGCVKGQFPYLLKRDLSPVNDNTPMWLNEAA